MSKYVVAMVLGLALVLVSLSSCDMPNEDYIVDQCEEIVERERAAIIEEAYAECTRATAEFLVALRGYFSQLLEDLGCVHLNTNYWDCSGVCK